MTMPPCEVCNSEAFLEHLCSPEHFSVVEYVFTDVVNFTVSICVHSPQVDHQRLSHLQNTPSLVVRVCHYVIFKLKVFLGRNEDKEQYFQNLA